MSQTSILSTKTLSDEQRQAFLAANFDLLEQDFIEIKNNLFELNTINTNLIFSSQNAVLSLMEQNGWEALKTKSVFCVGIKTKDLLELNGFKVDVYMDYASELAEIITLIYNKESYTFLSGNLRKETLPQALKNEGITFNEIEVYQTKLAPFKISDQEKFDGILFFSPSGVESYLTNNKIKNEICFCVGNTTAKTLELNKVKNIVIAETPTIEEVIEEVIEYYKTEGI
ncbi:uroporphyrinogen-III synthase [Flavobacterium sp. CG_23.5]|uniref:uroporphyrinogen-III synthase n=1 Tax=unclassified Flavobacterium TaxID=196869 RepID=UPI0018CB5F18|nr:MULTISPECIES: uroporphyrinogen-III synthase [unclassified Flavobacterium]MBG6109175.1 uroporphyrinogen-III synthase [Flavobacterium sp. CG_9.10]MBP2283560.1 uroporphyrinogen-III synthase [Flavobacterium sp. CG_23.5]